MGILAYLWSNFKYCLQIYSYTIFGSSPYLKELLTKLAHKWDQLIELGGKTTKVFRLLVLLSGSPRVNPE